MRAGVLALAVCAACKFDPLPSLSGDGGGDGGGSDACVGIGCNVQTCEPGDETVVTGTVLMPNGTVPLANVDVYIPASDPGPMATGIACARCGPLPGDPVVKTRSGADGTFRLVNAPAGDNIPLVITIGKWRRQVVLPRVNACEETAVPVGDSRLPRQRAEGDMPRIAVTTGRADALECVVRKLGIDDSEFGTSTGPHAVHLFYAGPLAQAGTSSFQGGSTFEDASATLWPQLSRLMQYDAVLLSCEGTQNAQIKPQTAMQTMKDYADAGGRIFASHYQNVWIDGELGNPSHAPPVWRDLAMFDNASQSPTEALIDTTHPAGMVFGAWQMNVTSAGAGRIPIASGTGRTTLLDVLDEVNTTQYAYLSSAPPRTHILSFDTPVESMASQRCGRVVFSDLHHGSGSMSMSSTPFPSGCTPAPMAPQDLAIAYMLFELQRCVGTPP